MMKIKIQYILLILFCFSLGVSAQPKLKTVFNGKNLKGWTTANENIWWTIDAGILKGQSDSNEKGSILWTKKEYTNFVFETDFRFGEGTVDSGIFIRNDKQQIQLGISGSLKRDMTASPYIAGKGYPVEAKNIKKLLKQKDWNTIKIQAKAGHYQVWLNDEFVMKYTSNSSIEKGPIGLQLHPNRNMAIDFRNIKIGKLK